MKKKHSIALGISFLAGISYIAYTLYTLFFALSKSNQMQDFGEMFAVVFAGNLLLPHLLMILLGSILDLIGWIKDRYGYGLAATIVFGVSIFFRFGYIFVIAVLLVGSLLGCVTCYKRKEQFLEAEEERRYREAHPQKQKMKERHNYAKRQILTEGNNPASQTNVPTYANQGTVNVAMPQQNYGAYPYGMQDPYAPLSPQQVLMNTSQGYVTPMPYAQSCSPQPMAPVMEPMSYPQPQFMGYPAAPQPTDVYSPEVMLPQSKPKIFNGYFDDYGNFHPEGEEQYNQ